MKMYPVKFEIVDDIDELVCSVEMADEACATVTVKTVVTEASWRELGELVLKALQQMELEGDSFDPHIGCFSYPNCDIDHIGCCVRHGSDAEPIGARG
jgi:chaperonin GroEL (HSP60 family)